MQPRGMPNRPEAGFTLIEMLIVIVVLGVLAAVVVFSVSGISDVGQSSACKSDRQAVVTAEEAMRARSDVRGYLPMADLVTVGMLQDDSAWHDVTFPDAGTPVTTKEGHTVTIHATYSVAPITGSPC